MTIFRSDANSLLQTFQALLWKEWDPIGVNDGDGDWPDDEYDNYATQLLTLVQTGKSKVEIEAYLTTVETEYMGLGPSGRSGPVAERAIQIFGERK
ncbi:hypothetical protein [Parerythrobacter jejuensis]|uniref:Uncharacterized protein n=1 Tax=Parerythrobacter jejuensis TaxID=795812 RepID=A0A845ARW8_9SPHN|nr:hypothetical protein [Parerythrobacter jejuensis]MXP32127.1 hypothetical protein [Parerythrobacter jejuensis]